MPAPGPRGCAQGVPALSARAASAQLLSAGLVAAAGTWIATGAVGDDFRWIGVLGLSEMGVLTGLRWTGWLRGRPWARLVVRLVAAVVAVRLAGVTMPSADEVGWVFSLEGALLGAWVGASSLVARGRPWSRPRPDMRGASVLAGVGLWFMSVPVPPSGWSPVVGVLVATTALGTRRGTGVEEES